MDQRANDRAVSWRPFVAVSGLLLFAGGGMHPSAPEGLSFRDKLAAMMEEDAWVPSHTLVTVSALLLLFGLLIIRRRGSWPAASAVLPFAIAATAAYAVELVLHTVSVVDKEELAAGESPAIAVAHLAAAVITYPLFGAAIAVLAWKLMSGWSAPLRAVSIVGIVGGVAQALSAPLVVVARQEDFDVLFAVGGITIAIWLVVLGIAGLRAPVTARPVPATV